MDVRRRDELLVALGGVLLLVALFALPWWEASADGVEITGTLDGWKACYRSRCATGDLSLFPSVTHWFSVLLGLGSVAVGGAGLLGVRLHDSIAAWLSRFALICVAMLAWKLLRTPTFGFVVVFVELHRGPGLVVGLAGAALAAFGLHRLKVVRYEEEEATRLAASVATAVAPTAPPASGTAAPVEAGRFTGISGPAGASRSTGSTAAPPVGGASGTSPPPLGRARPVKHIAPIEIDFGADDAGAGASDGPHDPFAPPPERRR
jgi:hypothetical protein